MAKLQVYKFVNPGVSNLKSPTVAAARKQTLALNRLGGTVSSIGTLVSDIERIAIRQIKNDKLRAKAERRRERRELDQATEEAIENKKAAKTKKPKLSKTSLKIAKGGLSWIEKFLAPIGKFLGFIARIAITKEVLEWVGDPANIEKLSDFLEKTHFVFKKLFGWAAGFTDNILEGFSALTDPNGTFIERLGGLGSIMKGLIGLKYLMNPFSIITDILALVDLLTGDRGGGRRGGRRRRNQSGNRNLNPNQKPGSRPGQRFRNKVTTSGGQSTGPFRGLREFLRKGRRFLGQKPNVSVSGSTGGGWWQKLFGQKASDRVSSGKGGTPKTGNWWKDLFKKKNFTQGTGGVKGNWLQRLFKSKADPSKITEGVGGKSGNFFSKLFSGSNVTQGQGGLKSNFWTKGRNLITKFKPGGLIRGGGNFIKGGVAYAGIDWAINEIIDAVVFDPLGRYQDKKLENAVDERFLATGAEATIQYYQNELEARQKLRAEQSWWGKLNLGTRNQLDDVQQGRLQHQLDYARSLTENRDISGLFSKFETPKLQQKKNDNWFTNLFKNDKEQANKEIKKEKEKKKSGNWFSNLFGGKKEEKKEEKKKKSGNWFSNLFGGNKKQETPKKKQKKKKTNWWSGLFSKKKPEKKEKKSSWWPFAEGGELQEMLFGGLWKRVKKIGSGIWNGVTNVVNKISSNPIISTALSFIPGMQIPMAVINGINSLQQGNVMGAVMSAFSGLSQFAAIGSTAQSVVNTPNWLMNLRMSGFGQGLSNLYTSGANAWSSLTSGFNNFMGSKWGQIGQQVLSGDYMGALNTFNPKWGGIASDIMSGNYGGALSAFNPEMGAAVTKGLSMIDSFRQDPMGLISNIAEQQGMGGLLKAVTGLFGGGDKVTAMTQIASEMGIDPKVLGAVKSVHQQALTEGGISSQWAMEQAMEFIPIPTIIEKIVTIPQAVAINTGGGNQIIVTAPNSLLERMK